MHTAFPDLLVGVLVAVGAFLIQELVRYWVAGVFFRRRTFADVLMVVSAFEDWSAPVATQTEDTGISVNPIWDYSYENLGDVYRNASHLAPDLFSRLIRFYGSCGRFDEIRCSYNHAIMELVRSRIDRRSNQLDRSPWIPVLEAHLMDIGKVAKDIASEGRLFLTDMASRYTVEAATSEMMRHGG
jgi:hypothetical protein